jgi:hypothetical protein
MKKEKHKKKLETARNRKIKRIRTFRFWNLAKQTKPDDVHLTVVAQIDTQSIQGELCPAHERKIR